MLSNLHSSIRYLHLSYPHSVNAPKTCRYLSSYHPKTLFDKVWSNHLIDTQDDGTCLIGIDRHLVHEVTSPQAFEGLRVANRGVRHPERTLVTPDHNVPTSKERLNGLLGDTPESILQVQTLDRNAKKYKLPYFALNNENQGIVHVVSGEQGFTLPGTTVVCGDSHTSTHGAFGALAFGIGTSEVEHVLATQSLLQKPSKNMRISIEGDLPFGVVSKDVIMHIIGVIGTAGGSNMVIEFSGPAIEKMSMEARMSICNMSIEAGSRSGMIAPDETTFAYLKGRSMSPKGEIWERAVKYWKTLPSDHGARYDKELQIRAEDIAPQVTWGTNPEMVIPVTGTIPNPKDAKNEAEASSWTRALDYMDLVPGQHISDVKVDKVFVGSCTNARIEDLRAVAQLVKGKKIASNIKHAIIVPGSGLVKKQAITEGLDKIFFDAGFDFREPGCSMCIGMNMDQLKPHERCASTSNRNFEGRQGTGGRTHLLSPAMAAAAALSGRFADVRDYMKVRSLHSCTRSNSRRSFSSVDSAGAGLEPFTTLTGVAAPLPRCNIDTDTIIPSKFLKIVTRSGLGVAVFNSMRYSDGDKVENPDFILNKPEWRSSSVLVVGENFGCGSSREHAPWALLDFGIRCIISTKFADIFYNNCFKNGILPIIMDQALVDQLMLSAQNLEKFTVDLKEQSLSTSGGKKYSFEIDPFRKHCLLNGLDDISLTMQKMDKIEAYEKRITAEQPWI